MFKSINIKEEKLLQETLKLCLIEPNYALSKAVLYPSRNNKNNFYKHHIYCYPVVDFSEGITVFKCNHILTHNSLILDTIELCGTPTDSGWVDDIDEQVVYSLIPFVIKSAIEWTKLNKKNVTVLKSSLPHFADHLIDQGFTLHNRINLIKQGLVLRPIIK
jgi:hypothetical protein